VVGPGYSPIPERLVTKIKTGQFVDLADLLAKNYSGSRVRTPHLFGWQTPGLIFSEGGPGDYRHLYLG